MLLLKLLPCFKTYLFVVFVLLLLINLLDSCLLAGMFSDSNISGKPISLLQIPCRCTVNHSGSIENPDLSFFLCIFHGDATQRHESSMHQYYEDSHSKDFQPGLTCFSQTFVVINWFFSSYWKKSVLDIMKGFSSWWEPDSASASELDLGKTSG